MGEHHVAQSRPRVIGELSLAEVYLSKVVNLNNEVSRLQISELSPMTKAELCGATLQDADAAKKLQRKIRELQLA